MNAGKLFMEKAQNNCHRSATYLPFAKREQCGGENSSPIKEISAADSKYSLHYTG